MFALLGLFLITGVDADLCSSCMGNCYQNSWKSEGDAMGWVTKQTCPNACIDTVYNCYQNDTACPGDNSGTSWGSACFLTAAVSCASADLTCIASTSCSCSLNQAICEQKAATNCGGGSMGTNNNNTKSTSNSPPRWNSIGLVCAILFFCGCVVL
eukprot:TRINITY_DN2651_c0_g1_i1.p1 TRINITY_DN2651_c0_g1~~TRINITY_DN2651_c0_g1_i1.p1  ORF type:complete len:174 (+),score=42.60 TRINITY_DN2651_c0_g1_i1:60-524(+)